MGLRKTQVNKDAAQRQRVYRRAAEESARLMEEVPEYVAAIFERWREGFPVEHCLEALLVLGNGARVNLDEEAAALN